MEFVEMTFEEVCKYLEENNLYGEISQPLYNSKYMANVVYDIEVICGDWKHEHGFLEYLMNEKGYYQTREDLIHDEYTDDGDDCYSSTHRFVAKPYYELFNGKVA